MKTTLEQVRMHMLALKNGEIFPVARGAGGYAVRVYPKVANDNPPAVPSSPGGRIDRCSGNQRSNVGGCNDRD